MGFPLAEKIRFAFELLYFSWVKLNFVKVGAMSERDRARRAAVAAAPVIVGASRPLRPSLRQRQPDVSYPITFTHSAQLPQNPILSAKRAIYQPTETPLSY